MELDLICSEWQNTNKNAHLLSKKKKIDKNKKQNGNNTNQNSNYDSIGLIYLLKIVGKTSESELDSHLACLSSDQIINIYDQQNLKLLNHINLNNKNEQTKTTNDIGFFKQTTNMLFSCGDDGQIKCWDYRIPNNITPAISFDYSKNQRELLCADINSTDTLISGGTTRNVDDCLIYIYDIRFNDRYLFKLSESHSKDISQVKFDHINKDKFVSASLDGLVCLYDLNNQTNRVEEDNNSNFEYNKHEPFKKNDNYSDTESVEKNKYSEDESEDNEIEEEDPDLMDQVLNADASIYQIGYLKKNQSYDQLYAITYTNELLIWDLNTYDLVKRFQSSNFSESHLQNDDKNYDPDFSFFDCFYMKSFKNMNDNLLTFCLSDKNGNMKLVQNDEFIVYDSLLTKLRYNEISKLDHNNHDNRPTVSHRDCIRSSYWNEKNFYTVGEDGYLIKWDVGIARRPEKSVDKSKRKKRNKYDDEGSDFDVEKEDHKNEKLDLNNKKNKNKNFKK